MDSRHRPPTVTRLLAAAVGLLATARPASTATLTLNASQDPPIQQDSATTNFGTAVVLPVKSPSSAVKRTLVQFALTSVPACATITAAILRLHIDTNTQDAGPGNDKTYAAIA